MGLIYRSRHRLDLICVAPTASVWPTVRVPMQVQRQAEYRLASPRPLLNLQTIGGQAQWSPRCMHAAALRTAGVLPQRS